MGAETIDPRMMSIKPRLRYNTIGGINGPLVVLENVSVDGTRAVSILELIVPFLGQIPTFQRNRLIDPPRRH